MVIDTERPRARLQASKKELEAELNQLQEAGRPSEERREGSPFGKREEEATESMDLERRLALERGIKEPACRDRYCSGQDHSRYLRHLRCLR